MYTRHAFLSVVLVSLGLLATTGRAAPVDAGTARTVAEAFLRGTGGGDDRFRVSGRTDVAADGKVLGYLFQLDPQGYVAVAADDELPPVIAYALEPVASGADAGAGAGIFEAETPNPLASLLAADLQARLRALPRLTPGEAASRHGQWTALILGTWRRGEPGRFDQWPPAGSTPTGGWLAGNWTQNAPYNALCPLDLAHGGTRSLAGCPSVAMAMILDYRRTIQGTAFTATDRYWHNYAGNAYWIPDAYLQYGFPSFPTLNGYLMTLAGHWSQGAPLTNTDKAALVFACGVAARQVYSAAGSGTFGVDQAFAAYQRFAFTGSRLVHDTDPEMYPDLAANMRDARPAHLAIVDPAWSMGHNVVVDGYNTDNYFHLNFGWGGAYNGWYLLPQEIPYGLTVVEGLILDIVPMTSTAGPSIGRVAGLLGLSIEPNPAAGSATISFTAPVAAHAGLEVFDPAGRLVAKLLDAEVAPGERSVWWNAGNAGEGAGSGVYWARLTIAGRTATRRIVIIR